MCFITCIKNRHRKKFDKSVRISEFQLWFQKIVVCHLSLSLKNVNSHECNSHILTVLCGTNGHVDENEVLEGSMLVAIFRLYQSPLEKEHYIKK